ncbi:unnamed protein product [Fraxinus pennsylvanica]|uniref:Rab3-GAP regulatory subunit N-terminal domain-containing protein n=1 Tax=Fraxinus pennsylvanica TaxID=56036 RepID=A0AAD2ECA0_9LAMI|nr:unnamed protein product [Fraxinus pennsylvanica]
MVKVFHYQSARPVKEIDYSEDSEISFTRLPYQLWNVSKYGPCSDAAIIGVVPPPLMEIQLLLLLDSPINTQHYYCAVTIGYDAVISAFSFYCSTVSALSTLIDLLFHISRLSEDKSRSLVGAILSKVVPATFSTLASFSKLIWHSEQKPTKNPEVNTQPFARAFPWSRRGRDAAGRGGANA